MRKFHVGTIEEVVAKRFDLNRVWIWVYYSPLEEDEGNQPRISRELLVKASGFIIMCLKVSSLVKRALKWCVFSRGCLVPPIAQIKINLSNYLSQSLSR